MDAAHRLLLIGFQVPLLQVQEVKKSGYHEETRHCRVCQHVGAGDSDDVEEVHRPEVGIVRQSEGRSAHRVDEDHKNGERKAQQFNGS